VLACRDMAFLWDMIVDVAGRRHVIAAGDTACGFGNTAMVMADKGMLPGVFAAVVRAYTLHMDINCGCFAKPEPLTGMTVLRDGALLVLALLMTVFAFQEAGKPHPWTAAAPEQSS